MKKAKHLLSHKYFPLGLVLISFLLALPSVRTGWFADDLPHRAAYVDTPASHEYLPEQDRLVGPMRMYSFFDRDEDRFRRALDLGWIPWWAQSDKLAAFWRPLTAYLSMLDYQFWPESSALMHIHSVCWFAALVLIAYIVYRRIFGAGWAAGLAGLLFTANDLQAVPINFLANRHILLGAVFGICVLWSHHRWRKETEIQWAIAANIFLLISVLASESGVAVLGYLIAYSLFFETGNVYTKLRPLVSYVILIVIWRVLYTGLGYGIVGLDLYVDPGREPVQFLFAVIERLPILLHGMFLFPSPAVYAVLTPLAVRIYWYISVALLLLLGTLFSPFWRENRTAQFWLVGTILATIPLCAPFPGGRSLILPSFGAMGLLAQLAKNAAERDDPVKINISRRFWIQATLLFVIAIRIVIGSATLVGNHRTFAFLQKGIDLVADVDINDSELSQKTLIFMNPPSPVFAGYVIPIRTIRNDPVPAHVRVLSSGLDPVEIHRADKRTLVVRPRGGYMRQPNWQTEDLLSTRAYIDPVNALRRFERLLLTHTSPFTLGEEIKLTDVTIRITELTDDARPAEATFVFDVALEDPSLKWLQWNMKEWKYEEFIPPEIGETVQIK